MNGQTGGQDQAVARRAVEIEEHYSLNVNETNRHWPDAVVDPTAHRESDLLAFQIAIERPRPGAIMTGYDKVNGEYAGHLLNEVLKEAGFGLSYTTFQYDDFSVTASGDSTVTASFRVTNTGGREGAVVPQLYLTSDAGEPRLRLLGFERVMLQPGESREVTITTDPRLLARFDGEDGLGEWEIAGDPCEVALGRSAGDFVAVNTVALGARRFGH